ncbi:hypothetical protein SAMN05216571_104252 [Onishia taeanensis]|uniref:Uncharacterized protein n=1 Tax=Onishia taeanensis TaxID=284577 RepID=A0A1G7RGJ6_9GAMM|nr:hypothetical protein [Halomonas taeanensis]SDG09873.1 hypothetical protein SAMN05216571_104252 [Halomonas taeanensis]
MRVVHVNNVQQRESCLARLCAEVYGHQAGLAPLATFAGTLGVLVKQEAARVFALVDNQSRPVALALLVLDEAGQGMEVSLLSALEESSVANPVQRLVQELALRAPLKVVATDSKQETMFRDAGIKRWFDGEQGRRIGLGAQHPAEGLDDVTRTLAFDEGSVVASFKQDKEVFESYKSRFVRGLESFPTTL